MRIGKLRHRVEIQQQQHTQDPQNGEMVETWVALATVWASIEPLSVRDFVASNANQSEVTARIVIRHRDDVDSTCRAVYRGKVYNVVGVMTDAKSGVEYLTLAVNEGVNNG